MKRRTVGVLPLAATIFFVVSGGPYTTEQVIGKSGPLCGLLILAILPIIWSLPVGLMTAELSARFPEEGGYVVWVKNALGPFAGFLCAWWSWTSSWVDLALYPLVAVHYATKLTGPITHPHLWILGIIGLMTILNILGIREVGRISAWLMYLVVAIFTLVFVLGMKAWISSPPAHVPFLNGPLKWDGLGAAMVLGLWNYFGWDSLTTASGEVDGANKSFPKAILLSVGLVSALVVLPVLGGIALKTDWANWDNDAGYWPEIARAGWAPLFAIVIGGGVLSNIGVFSANLLASSRIPYVLAEDRYLPEFVIAKHPRFGTPWVAILIAAVLAALLSRESFDKLVAIDLSLYLLALLLELAALVVFRKRGAPHYGFRIGGGSAGLCLCVALPVLVAGVALFLQLNPATKVADLAVSPLLILLGLAATGPLFYGYVRVFRPKG